jgi:dihydropteroate synthase
MHKALLTNNTVTYFYQQELAMVLAAADKHVPRWLQIVDVGLGFAKNTEHNIELMIPKNSQLLKTSFHGRPVLVGASRKRFIGAILDPSFDDLEARYSVVLRHSYLIYYRRNSFLHPS